MLHIQLCVKPTGSTGRQHLIYLDADVSMRGEQANLSIHYDVEQEGSI